MLGNDLGQVVHTHVCLSPSSVIWTSCVAAMSCDWQDNCRSGFTLAMCHRLQWFIHLWTRGLSDKQPANIAHVVSYSSTELVSCVLCAFSKYFTANAKASTVTGFSISCKDFNET